MTGKARAGKAEDTHANIFQVPEVKPQHPVRLAYIRDNKSNGRAYDIVTGARTEYVPPTISERKNPRQAHPSIMTSTTFR